MRFPGDISIFTGKLSRERMVDEHPVEYARALGVPVAELVGEDLPPMPAGDEASTV